MITVRSLGSVECLILYITHQSRANFKSILYFISSGLDSWSVNCTSIFENLNVFKNINLFNEISSNWSNDLSGINDANAS